MGKKSIVIFMSAILTLGTMAGCGSTVIPAETSETSVVSEDSVEESTAIQSISFGDVNQVTVEEGETIYKYLYVTGSDISDEIEDIEFISNNRYYAKVSADGLEDSNTIKVCIEGVNEGTTTIYAKIGNIKSETITITVQEQEESSKQENSVNTVLVSDIEGITFNIPENCTTKINDDGDDIYFYCYPESNDGIYMFYVYSTSMYGIFNQSFADDFIEGVTESETFNEMLSDEEIEICNQYCRKLKYSSTISGINYECYIYVFANNNRLYSIANAYPESFGNIYEDEFNNLIKSIKLTEVSLESETSTQEISDFEYYSAGTYKIGVDMPAGEYIVYPTSSVSGYYKICSDSTGDFDSIVHNETFDGQMYLTVSEGQYLTIERSNIYPVSKAKTIDKSSGKLEEGMYKVGTDIPAGEYKLTCTDTIKGYLCVYSSSTCLFDDIVTNDNFEGSTYITVQDGQYLYINRCVLNLS